MNEYPARRRSDEEADRWYYDLGRLAEQVEVNQAEVLVARKTALDAQERANDAQRKANTSVKRLWVLTAFVLGAGLLLSYRSEVAADRIATVQQKSCEANLEVVRNFNAEQDALIDIDRVNPDINDVIRAARIKAYLDVKIIPLPVCGLR